MGRFVLDGVPVSFSDDDSVAVAITRTGEHPLHGGTLCLAGDCGNCVAIVDGTAWVRTCQVDARPGMVVQRHPAVGAPSAFPTAISLTGDRSGEVEIVGRIAPPPSKLFELSGAESGPIRQNLDIPVLALEIHVPLRPLSVQQLAPDGQAGVAAGADANLVRQWPTPTVDVGKHQGYAFQWFALCALITGLTLWFQLLSPRINPSHGRPN